ncbi:bactofilin family protein [Coralloluteibacterium stylophorae]|uniref:Polymer-forming cytoskeletal protein n=1 Tax=Coralloluteibacterium stylophorae TaxID=1776034 RepID=A0A8J8AYV2_9GAMM|nr:polymer-forming cytoskeletal protein [Coralloluteibacterium stylophorae]MBS7458464.1 polymer-forming cytoskeletal protein [Coralloluteibacterium stylophorae]
MFGDNKRSNRGSAPQVDTLIGAGVTVRGDIAFRGGLYIEGRVYGSISAEGDEAVLTIAEHGFVEGEVSAPVVVVNGQLRGDVHASGRVELAAQARVEGNVHYKVVSMAAGAMLSGRLIHSEARAALTGPGMASSADEEAADERAASPA